MTTPDTPAAAPVHMHAPCACPPDVWARRVQYMGADLANIDLSDPAEPGAYRPWAADVMILAGLVESLTDPGAFEVNLWLACRLCGWTLGYSPQCTPAYLAEQASRHAREYCEQSGASTRAFYSTGQGKDITSWAWSEPAGTWIPKGTAPR